MNPNFAGFWKYGLFFVQSISSRTVDAGTNNVEPFLTHKELVVQSRR